MVARKKSKSMTAKAKTTKKSKAKAKAKTKAKTKTKAKKTKAKKAKTKSSAKKVKRAKSPPAKSRPAAKSQAKAKSGTKAKSKTKSTRQKPVQPQATAPATPPAPASTTPLPQQTAPAPSNPPAGASLGFEVLGTNASAPFTLKLHRGDGMTLLGMNWKDGKPPLNFVGFAIECQVPGGQFVPLTNRLNFLDANGNVVPGGPTLQAPIQKFRWVHFPFNADLAGDFNYRVTPIFIDANDKLTQGPPQQAAIQLARETYPGIANVTFTRGFVSSQAFVEHYSQHGDITTLVAPVAAKGLDFKPTHPDTATALPWMGFEARAAILETLDQAIAAGAQVRVVGYDFNLPDIVDRLEKLGNLVKVIIDDSKGHGGPGTAETEAEGRLVASAGRNNVKRQHMGDLQHNKTIAVGPPVNKVVFGSTNLSWRGFYVQANNALVLTGETAFKLASDAFDRYFAVKDNAIGQFDGTSSADWNDLKLPGIDAKVAFSPHSAANAKLGEIAADLKSATSSVLYSLAFLYETKKGAVRDAIDALTANDNIFVYGISDRHVGGLDVQDPNGNVAPVFAAELGANVPEPFKSEPTGGTGTRMHHKFTVIDFDKPTARVYLGSYNFSNPADLENGENLVLVRDRRIAVSYMIEALSIFDHYSFRVAEKTAHEKNQKLHLVKPPRAAGDKPWWDDDFTVPHKIKDRILFS
jgi:PLD-like domain